MDIGKNKNESENNKPKKRLLENMKKNMRDREIKNKNKSMFPLTQMDLFVLFIKKQNEKLLEKIAEDKIRNKEEREDFIEKYLKINYYVPEIVQDIEDELVQKNI